MRSLDAIGEYHESTLLRILRGIEQLPKHATGALEFLADGEKGTILVENKRICWAATSFMGQRLTNILRDTTGDVLTEDIIMNVFEVCAELGRPLGEVLVENGYITETHLATSLLKHSAEAIGALSLLQKPKPSWVPNTRRDYEAQFAFTTAEILTAVGALGKTHVATEARRRLEESTAEGATGLAFPSNRSVARLPIAQIRSEHLGVLQITELGDWARETIHHPQEPARPSHPYRDGDGTRVTACEFDNTIFVSCVGVSTFHERWPSKFVS